jgi:hypothetical protein
MSQYLIAFCYLVTIFLLFLAFFIVRAVPSGSPFNIDLYRDNTIISFAIYNPAELQYRSGPPQEKVREHDWNTDWNAQDDQDSYNRFNDENAWNAPQDTADQPHTDTPEWIDWVFALISTLTRSERSQDVSLRSTSATNYEAEHGIPFPRSDSGT